MSSDVGMIEHLDTLDIYIWPGEPPQDISTVRFIVLTSRRVF